MKRYKTKVNKGLLFLFFGIVVLQLSALKVLAQKSKTVVKVLSFNIHHGNPPNTGDKIDLAAIAKVVIDHEADIIALQEVDKHNKRSEQLDQANELAAVLKMNYHFYKAIDHGGGEYGLAILSKYEISDAFTVELPQQHKAEKRILAIAHIKIGRKKLVFANTHLDAQKNNANRVLQAQFIADYFKEEKLPILLCGDFNDRPDSETMQVLAPYFTRYCTNDCEPTYPQDQPRITIDYVMSKNIDWNMSSYRVLDVQNSDHRPILVQFEQTKTNKNKIN